MKKDSVNNKGIEVEDSYKLRMIADGIVTFFTTFIITFAFVIAFLIFPEAINISSIIALIFLQILMLPFGVLLISEGFLKWYPVYRVKCQISAENFVFYIQNRIYFQIKWNDINRIEFIREPYAMGMGEHADTYKIRLFSLNKIKDIRLYALRFRSKNVKLILSKLEEFSIILNTEMEKISELKREPGIYQEQYKDEQEILEFYKNRKQKIRIY